VIAGDHNVITDLAMLDFISGGTDDTISTFGASSRSMTPMAPTTRSVSLAVCECIGGAGDKIGGFGNFANVKLAS